MLALSRFNASLLALAVGLLTPGCLPKHREGGAPQNMAFPVNAAKPVVRNVVLTDVYTGRFDAVEAVELRARVSGYLDSVHFQEGKLVKKGDLMFRIDARQFEALAASAAARVKQAEASLALAKVSYERAKTLVQDNTISRQDFDARSSEFAQAEANLQAARADLRSAELNVEFASVSAPISGIAGRFLATPGNFITGGSAGATLLTTIVPHDPIYCYFETDERKVLQFTRLYFEGKAKGREGEPTIVDIAVSDSPNFEFKGRLTFVANRLDPNTATLQLRAEVDNKSQFLTPGLFAKVKVPAGPAQEVMMVQDSALGFDQTKRFAWVIGEENLLERRFVEVGRLQDGMRIITGGLKPEERIAVSGIQLLRPGIPVAPTDVAMEASATPAPEEKKP